MLYIDCGHTVSGAPYTGIQRYVRHTLRQAHALLGSSGVRAIRAGPEGWSCLAVLPAHPLEGLPPVQLAGGPACFDGRAHVLLADRLWHTQAQEPLDALLASPAHITLVVFDLLSLRHPGWFPDGVGRRFERYLDKVLARADRVVCLSDHVRSELASWASGRGISTAAVGVVGPGHEVWDGPLEAPPLLPRSWREGLTPFVLQVGTLEPRKNHALTLRAMQRQWDRGRDVGCLFVGQRGWGMDAMMQAMSRLPQWRHQLQWLSECTDAQLAWCYRRAAAVCYPSANEGYGLPLAEAACAGASVIASDTAVHREVAASLRGAAVRLVEPGPAFFDEALTQALAHPPGRAAHRGPARTWKAATADLLRPAMGALLAPDTAAVQTV